MMKPFASLSLLVAVLSVAMPQGTAVASPKASSTPAGGHLAMPLATGTVIRSNGRRAIMSVESTLTFEDGALLERAKLSQPRLNAAFNEAVRTEASRMLPDTVPDTTSLTRTLQRAADQVLGRQGAKVMLGTVMVI